MPIVSMRCPSCSGDIQVDDEKSIGFCMYCGNKILIQSYMSTVRLDNSHMVDNWMKLGQNANRAGNYEEAENFFSKVLEVNPNNYLAILNKGYAAGMLSTYDKPRINELLLAIRTVNDLAVSGKLPENSKTEVFDIFASTFFEVNQLYMTQVSEKKSKMNFHWIVDDKTMEKIRSLYVSSVANLQEVLNIVTKGDLPINLENIINLKKEIVNQCSNVCWPLLYYKDKENIEVYLWGFSKEEKRKYFELADKLIVDIRLSDPGYWNIEKNVIDRISIPPEVEPRYEIDYNMPDVVNQATKSMAFMEIQFTHMDQVTKAEKEAEKTRVNMLTAMKQQKYWDEHPKEYQAHVVEEKKKAEAKAAKKKWLKSILDEKQSQLEAKQNELESQITQLQKERQQLGFFAMSRKSQLDNEISSLKQKFDAYARSIDIDKARRDYNNA
jgi:hypothetical protein